MSLDKIGQTDANRPPIKPSMKFEGTFFTSTRSPKRQYFTIHPEWLSENSTPYKTSPSTESNSYSSAANCSSHQAAALASSLTGRRCRSAPPNWRSRNPITWEHW